MMIGNTEAAIRVMFGRNTDYDMLIANCKRMYMLAYVSNTYVRFENVCTGMHIEDIEINPQYYAFDKFVATYKQVIKQHIYCRTRKY